MSSACSHWQLFELHLTVRRESTRFHQCKLNRSLLNIFSIKNCWKLIQVFVCINHTIDLPSVLFFQKGNSFFMNLFDLHIWLSRILSWHQKKEKKNYLCSWKLSMNKSTVSKCLFIHLWIFSSCCSSVVPHSGTLSSVSVKVKQ